MLHRRRQTAGPGPRVIEASLYSGERAAAWTVAESPAVHRPRHPERAGFCQLFETHFDRYVRAYEERFEPPLGTLAAGGRALGGGFPGLWTCVLP